MSKVVKGVTRAVGKVVSGINRMQKKIRKSKIGKIIIGAALVYFGGAALMGGMSGAAAGGASGFMSGASAGLSSAWSGLTGAVSGGGLSSLASGFTGAGAAGSAAAGSASALAAGGGAAGMGGSIAGMTGAAVPTAGTSIFANPMVQQAVVQGVSGMAQGAMQSKAANDAEERQTQLDEEQRARYNTNVGTKLSVFDLPRKA